MLAAKISKVDGLILIASPSKALSTIMLDQIRETMPIYYEQAEAIISELEVGRYVNSIPNELNALFRQSVQPYLISAFHYNPIAEIANLLIPILLIYGSSDIQIGTCHGQQLKEANHRIQYREIDGINHVLKIVSGSLNDQLPSYNNPELPIARQLIEAINEFISYKYRNINQV